VVQRGGLVHKSFSTKYELAIEYIGGLITQVNEIAVLRQVPYLHDTQRHHHTNVDLYLHTSLNQCTHRKGSKHMGIDDVYSTAVKWKIFFDLKYLKFTKLRAKKSFRVDRSSFETTCSDIIIVATVIYNDLARTAGDKSSTLTHISYCKISSILLCLCFNLYDLTYVA